jgi:hypothetical protein
MNKGGIGIVACALGFQPRDRSSILLFRSIKSFGWVTEWRSGGQTFVKY